MRCNAWVLNGAPIVFDADGRLLDGRTRLLACIRAAKAFDTLVVRGVSTDVFETFDSVRKRTLADILSIRSEIHGRALASALRIIWSYNAGHIPGTSKPPSPTTLLSLLEQSPEIRDSVLPALRSMPLLPHGCGIAIHYLASRIDSGKADGFISEIGQPMQNKDDSPIVQLRNSLISLRTEGGTRKQTYLLAITIKAFNSYYKNRSIKHLRYAKDRETFPHFEADLDWGPLGRVSGDTPKSKSFSAAELSVRTVMITPEIAEGLLSNRGPNRNVSASVINKYARDMAAGRWRLNGQTIKIASDGRLLDGQHRLEASKKARKPFPAIIVEGLNPNIFSSLDVGHRRPVSQILRERGESQTTILASALRWFWMIRNNVVLAANSSPTNGELLELLDEYPEIRTSVKRVSAIREIMGTGIAASLHCTFARTDNEKADEFFDRLIDGIQLAEHSPVRHLRERLLKTRTSHRVRLAEAERVAIAIKSWNNFVQDRPMQLLTWRNRGSTRELLPSPL